MVALAKSPTQKIQSADFIGELKMSASSAQQALAVLMYKDLVYRREDEFYCLLDPAMKYYLNVVLSE